jgi:ferredoxin
MMKHLIYYFSGTGNSLYLAKRIREQFEQAELIHITAVLCADAPTIQADVLGFVFPVYAWGPPKLVEEFVKRMTVSQPQYLFVAATHGGGPENTLAYMEKLLKSKNLRIDGAFDIPMPSNYITGSNPLSPEEARVVMERNHPQLSNILRQIAWKQRLPIPRSRTVSGKLKTAVIHPLFAKNATKQGRKFSTSELCKGCGLCTKLCPVENITLGIDNKPVWHQQCEYCLGCINWCPQQAIESGSATKGRNRYHHPDVSLKEMMEAQQE